MVRRWDEATRLTPLGAQLGGSQRCGNRCVKVVAEQFEGSGGVLDPSAVATGERSCVAGQRCYEFAVDYGGDPPLVPGATVVDIAVRR